MSILKELKYKEELRKLSNADLIKCHRDKAKVVATCSIFFICKHIKELNWISSELFNRLDDKP